MRGANFHSPNASSWRGAKLKHKDNYQNNLVSVIFKTNMAIVRICDSAVLWGVRFRTLSELCEIWKPSLRSVSSSILSNFETKCYQFLHPCTVYVGKWSVVILFRTQDVPSSNLGLKIRYLFLRGIYSVLLNKCRHIILK